jgi:tyrosine-protein kinase Etk/Wzc
LKQQIEDRHDLQSSKRLENYDDLSPSLDAEREELGISSSLLAVWRQRDFVWQALYVGLLFSTIIAFWITPEYESTTRIMPPEKQNIAGLAALVGNADDKLSALASDAVGLKSSGALYIGILNSRTVQDRLVERFDLKRLYGVSLLSQAREILSSRTQVSEDRKSGIIAVTVSDPSPARARDMS